MTQGPQTYISILLLLSTIICQIVLQAIKNLQKNNNIY